MLAGSLTLGFPQGSPDLGETTNDLEPTLYGGALCGVAEHRTLMEQPSLRRSKRPRSTTPAHDTSVQVTSSSTEVPADVHDEKQKEQPAELAVGDRVAATADRECHVPGDPSDGAARPRGPSEHLVSPCFSLCTPLPADCHECIRVPGLPQNTRSGAPKCQRGGRR